jgi:hypothetical protein
MVQKLRERMTEPTNGGMVPATTTAAPQTIQEVPRAMPAIPRPPIGAGAVPRGIVPTTFDEVKRIAATAVEAELGGKANDDKPMAVAQACMKIMKGLELGMTPTMALDVIAFINGRTCIYGKGVPALIRGRGHKIEEWETGTRMADDWTFHCRITRGDSGEVIERSFSVLDAKQAKLWTQEAKIKRFKKGGGESFLIDNDSPWFRFPQRMLPARARGYAAADGAPEALLGMYLAEEMQDVERAEREIQEEERGQLVAPPPPLAANSEPASSPDDVVQVAPALDEPAPVPAPSNQPNPAPEDAPTDEEIALALKSCLAAMEKATDIDRLDKLNNTFNRKFDGRISRKMAQELELAYENAFDRITGAGAG